MALLFLDEDPWLLEHESCEKLQREIMVQLTERQKYPRTSDKYGQISANIRLRLKQYCNEVDQLKMKLFSTPSKITITNEETERRARQIEVLQTKATQMQRIFEEQVSLKIMQERRELVGGDGAGDIYAGPSTSNNNNSNNDANLNVDQIRAKQKQMLGEQEQGLENLSKIISRQKALANTISDEVEYHNEILDGIGVQIDQTDQRVLAETGHVQAVARKDNTCPYWIVIILLFISILIVAFI